MKENKRRRERKERRRNVKREEVEEKNRTDKGNNMKNNADNTKDTFSQNYVPGGIHKLNTHVFKSLVLGATAWDKVNVSDQTVAWGATTAGTGIETKGFGLA